MDLARKLQRTLKRGTIRQTLKTMGLARKLQRKFKKEAKNLFSTFDGAGPLFESRTRISEPQKNPNFQTPIQARWRPAPSTRT
jgi:hypothetical protein